jgi:uncharacterized protein (TIGR02246 family)
MHPQPSTLAFSLGKARSYGPSAIPEEGTIKKNLRHLAITVLAIGSVAPVSAGEKMAACTGPQDACQKIVEVWDSFAAAVNKQDAAATAALFTDDAVWVLPDATLRGRQAIEKRVSDDFKMGFANEFDTVDEAHVGGDMAWVVGHWRLTITGPNNAAQPMQGRWGSVHVRDGGGWKIRMSTPNLDTTAGQ